MSSDDQSVRSWSCPLCTAACTFEAMQMCNQPIESCPALKALASGEIKDRRSSDVCPDFPSEFTFAAHGATP